MVVTGLKVRSGVVGQKIQIQSNSSWEAYQKVLKAMKSAKMRDITALDLTHQTSITMVYDDRIDIIVGSTADLERKLGLGVKVLKEQDAVTKEMTGTLDISIPGRAYFAPGKERVETTTAASTTKAPVTKKAGKNSSAQTRISTTLRKTARSQQTRPAGTNAQRMTSRSW